MFTLIVFSVFENAGMTMGIMPVAGIPLPFLSYGGSAMVGVLRRHRHRPRPLPEHPVSDAASTDRAPAGPDAGEVALAVGTRTLDDAGDDAPRSGAEAVAGGAGRRRSPRPGNAIADSRMALVTAVTLDLPNQHPTVVLREARVTPAGAAPSPIGIPDAVALSHAMRRIPTPRPLTHELMSQVLQRFDIDVVAVRIIGRRGRCSSPSSTSGTATAGRALVPALRRPDPRAPAAGPACPILIDARRSRRRG